MSSLSPSSASSSLKGPRSAVTRMQPTSRRESARSESDSSGGYRAVPPGRNPGTGGATAGSLGSIVADHLIPPLWRCWCGGWEGTVSIRVWQMLRGSRSLWIAFRHTLVFFAVWKGVELFIMIFIYKWLLDAIGSDTDSGMKSVFVTVLWWTWNIPLYILSFLLSFIRYQEIAQGACTFQNRRQMTPPSGLGVWKRFLETCGDEIHRFILVVVFLAAAKLLQLVPGFLGVPIVGDMIYWLSCSWMASFYAFEYVWTYIGWDLKQRIQFFENRWAYFAGFGAPLTAMTYSLPFFLGYSLYSTLFPLLIMLAAAAHPKPHRDDNPLRLFFLSSKVADYLLRARQGGQSSPAQQTPTEN